MSDESDFIRSLHDASLDTMAEQLRTLQRLKDLLAGPAHRDTPVERAHAPAPGSGNLSFDLARLSLSYYNQLLALSARYTDDFVERLLAGGRRAAAAAQPPGR